MRHLHSLLLPAAGLAMLAGCAPSGELQQAEPFHYQRVAEVANIAGGEVDVFSSYRSGHVFLETLRSGETKRIVIPAGSNGVSCTRSKTPTTVGPVGSGTCRIRYLEPRGS